MVTENPVADIVSARIFLRAGSSYESPEQAGLFSLLMALLTKGTTRLSSLEIAEAVESIGASLGSDASSDYSLISVKTVSADFPIMLKLAGEVLRSPSFPEAEVNLERRLTLQQIRSMQEQPFTVAYNHLRQGMYQSHPYGLPGIGTETSVAALTSEHLAQAHKQYFRPDNTVISIVGRIDPAQAISLVEEVFGDWPAPQEPLLEPEFPSVPVQGTRQAIPQDTNQSIVMVGYLAAPVKHPAYPVLKLINTYLGNGLSSRLFVEMREKRGLAYDVSAIYPTRLGLSQFVVYMGTAPENTPVALEGLRHEVERLCETPLTDEELQATKNKLLGQYALGKQTNAQIAQLNGWYEVLGLGTDFDQNFQTAIAAITAADAQAVAQEFFNQPYIALLGPASAIG
ncbi:insulinase family protein [Pseudanabaena sp. FACHB-2040]|nr:pitrilysin family protein [Pseudanabaena sp. FACHB-2040]MBD2260621.1 insulinase family protein [Pseudanabaena sp. FACHB-2040]